jgi:hypothetical protein
MGERIVDVALVNVPLSAPIVKAMEIDAIAVEAIAIPSNNAFQLYAQDGGSCNMSFVVPPGHLLVLSRITQSTRNSTMTRMRSLGPKFELMAT